MQKREKEATFMNVKCVLRRNFLSKTRKCYFFRSSVVVWSILADSPQNDLYVKLSLFLNHLSIHQLVSVKLPTKISEKISNSFSFTIVSLIETFYARAGMNQSNRAFSSSSYGDVLFIADSLFWLQFHHFLLFNIVFKLSWDIPAFFTSWNFVPWNYFDVSTMDALSAT